MSTITREAFISSNHKLNLELDLPPGVPTGAVVVTLTVKARDEAQDVSDSNSELRHFMDSPLFGAWSDREECSDPSEWVRSIRKPRYPDVAGGEDVR